MTKARKPPAYPNPAEANPKVNRQTADHTNSHNEANAPTQPHRSPNDTTNTRPPAHPNPLRHAGASSPAVPPAANPIPAETNPQTRSLPTRSLRLQTSRPHQPAHRGQSLQTTGLPKPGEVSRGVEPRRTASLQHNPGRDPPAATTSANPKPHLRTVRPHQPAHRDQGLQTTGLPKPGEANPKVNRQTADQTNSHNEAKAPDQPHTSSNDPANQRQTTGLPKPLRPGGASTTSRQPEPAHEDRPTNPPGTPSQKPQPNRTYTQKTRLTNVKPRAYPNRCGTPGHRAPPHRQPPTQSQPRSTGRRNRRQPESAHEDRPTKPPGTPSPNPPDQPHLYPKDPASQRQTTGLPKPPRHAGASSPAAPPATNPIPEPRPTP